MVSAHNIDHHTQVNATSPYTTGRELKVYGKGVTIHVDMLDVCEGVHPVINVHAMMLSALHTCAFQVFASNCWQAVDL